jgi:hypothetical protein
MLRAQDTIVGRAGWKEDLGRGQEMKFYPARPKFLWGRFGDAAGDALSDISFSCARRPRERPLCSGMSAGRHTIYWATMEEKWFWHVRLEPGKRLDI